MNESTVNQENKPLFYWSDGYFIEDQETAELMDSINAFGGEHGVCYVQEGWSHEQCQQHINTLLQQC